jgi:molybdopterin-binding protein
MAADRNANFDATADELYALPPDEFVERRDTAARDAVMAQVEIQAGPYRVVSLMSREAADDLGLEPGVLAVATVKSTNVVVQIPEA